MFSSWASHVTVPHANKGVEIPWSLHAVNTGLISTDLMDQWDQIVIFSAGKTFYFYLTFTSDRQMS